MRTGVKDLMILGAENERLLASFGDVGWEPTAIPVWRASDAPEVWRPD